MITEGTIPMSLLHPAFVVILFILRGKKVLLFEFF